MICNACGSDRLSKFNGELAIHLPGWKGLIENIVWVFPKILVCLNCGAAQFVVPEAELSTLGKKTRPA